MVLQLAPIAEMKDVELRIEHDDSVMVYGDLILIQNAVRNLIDNALKFSPAEACIYISVKSTPQPHVKIRDQGPGYPPTDLQGLTVRFARGANAEGIIGSGLGLTIAKDVASAHGGTLELFNHDKGGACVILSL